MSAITNQILLSFVLNPEIETSISLQAADTMIDLSVASINFTETDQASFISRFSSAVFKFIDTLSNKSEMFVFEAIQKLVDFFAIYISNTNFLWPWAKWFDFWNSINCRENVNQLAVTSNYRIMISQFMIACASLAGFDYLTSVVPSAVLSLVDIGSFVPTQPLRDQGMTMSCCY